MFKWSGRQFLLNSRGVRNYCGYKYQPRWTRRSNPKIQNISYPSGRTLAESWYALRKSWLGFKIAHNNGDFARMRHYASFITEVQREIGITVTKFDSDILDEQATPSIFPQTRDAAEAKKEDSSESIMLDEGTQKDDPDYDEIMGEARAALESIGTAPPREKTFATYKVRPRSCPDIREINDRQILDGHIVHEKCSCDFPPTSSDTHQISEEESCRRLLDKAGKISKEILGSAPPDAESERELDLKVELPIYTGYDQDNTPEEEIENDRGVPVHPAIPHYKEMYAPHYDRTDRSCPVPDIPSNIGSHINQASNSASREEHNALEKDHKRSLRACYFRSERKQLKKKIPGIK